MKLPESDKSLLLRTDFADAAAWALLCKAVQSPSKEGFQAGVECISDPACNGLTLEQLMTVLTTSGDRTFAFVADQIALLHAGPELFGRRIERQPDGIARAGGE